MRLASQPNRKTRHLKVGDQNHHAQQKQQRVPINGLISIVKRNNAGQHHGHTPAKSRSGAVQSASAVAFNRYKEIGDDKNRDGNPMVVAQRGEEVCHREFSGRFENSSLSRVKFSRKLRRQFDK